MNGRGHLPWETGSYSLKMDVTRLEGFGGYGSCTMGCYMLNSCVILVFGFGKSLFFNGSGSYGSGGLKYRFGEIPRVEIAKASSGIMIRSLAGCGFYDSVL